MPGCDLSPPAPPFRTLRGPPPSSQSPTSERRPQKGLPTRGSRPSASLPLPPAFCLTPLIFNRSCLLRDPGDGFPPSEVSWREIKVIYDTWQILNSVVARGASVRPGGAGAGRGGSEERSPQAAQEEPKQLGAQGALSQGAWFLGPQAT